ncbi:hypothetical protein, partial [Halomonas campaniensis]|uniref:hypothetical protein n=1 Tax=Halomonas campaniensis TaxID=213554 RepID=UPI0039706294
MNEKYLDRETGTYGSGLQTELSVALHWGLVPDESDVMGEELTPADRHYVEVVSLMRVQSKIGFYLDELNAN